MLVFKPGTKQAYQNGDYFVLQYILEKIGGKPIEQLLAEEVFNPLNMTDSGYDVEIRGLPFQTMLPVMHKTQNFTKGKSSLLIFKGFYSPTSYASAGMFLSISDAIKWAVSLDNCSILTNETQNEISQQTPLKGGFTQMGWGREVNHGHLMVGHSGGPGLGDVYRFPDEKLTVIVLSNYSDMNPYMAANVAKLFIPDLQPEKVPKTLLRKDLYR